MEKLLHSPTEAAKILGLSRSQVYYLVNTKALPARKIGSRTVIRTQDLHDFVDNLEAA